MPAGNTKSIAVLAAGDVVPPSCPNISPRPRSSIHLVQPEGTCLSPGAARRLATARFEFAKPPGPVAAGKRCSTKRRDVDMEDHLRRRTECVHEQCAGNQRRHYDDVPTIGPWMIIEHRPHPIDQLRETLPAMRFGTRIVQPRFEAGGVLAGDIDQCLAGPRPEIALAKLGDGLRARAQAYGSRLTSLFRSPQPGREPDR